MRTIVTVLIAFTALTMALIGCRRDISETDAQKIAAQQLNEYCSNHEITKGDFGDAKITSSEKYAWIFDYESTTTPRHLVRIYVGHDGRSELHRMIDDDTTK